MSLSTIVTSFQSAIKMKTFKKQLNKVADRVANKMEGVGMDIGHGITNVTQKIRGELKPGSSIESPHQAPLITRVPSFAETVLPNDNLTKFVGDYKSVTSHPNQDTQNTTGRARDWWYRKEGCDYLIVNIRDAKQLSTSDFETHSATTCVKVRVGDPEAGKSAYLEGCTRVIHRTRDPFWGQTFFFPLAQFNPDTPFSASVLASSSSGIQGYSSSGSVYTTLGYLLENIKGSTAPYSRWYQLTKKKSSDRVRGEVCMVVAILPRYIYDVIQWSEDGHNLLDPQLLKALMAPFTLQVTVDELRQMMTTLSADDVTELLETLHLFVSIGRTSVTKKVTAKEVATTIEGAFRIVSFKIEEKISIPLDKAFDVSYSWATKKKNKEEVGDIKIYLRHGKEDVLKTQVPIWDVPVYREPAKVPDKDASAPSDGKESLAEAEGKKWVVGDIHNTGTTWQMGAFQNWLVGMGAKLPTGRGATSAVDSCSIQESDFTPALSHTSGSSTAAVLPPAASAPSPLSTTSTPTVQGSAPSAVQLNRSSTSSLESADNMPVLTGMAIARHFMRPPCGPEGFLYKRSMERYITDIYNTPELHVKLVLLNTKLADASSAKVTLDDEAEDEEEVDKEGGGDQVLVPISSPMALDVVVSDFAVGAKPKRVFEVLFKADSEFRAKMVQKEDLKNAVTGNFVSDPELAKARGIRGAKSRTVTYVRPLTIPIPMAPKQCDVTEVHSLLVNEAGGFVVECKVTTNAPKGDAFFVLIQWVGISDGASNTKVRISFKVEFIKSVGFLKGAIEGGAVSSTKTLMKGWESELQKALPVTSVSVSEPGLTASQSLQTVSSMAVAAEIPKKTWFSDLSGLSLDSLTQIVFLLILLITLIYLGLAMWFVSQSVSWLAEALAVRLVSGHSSDDKAASDAVARMATQKVLEYLTASPGVGVEKVEL
ncbi:hypothetical protein CEUSTIGMA_g6592.t1 [Chlamydomonas eustigma]|uniref:Uncharacterized protein n=1 Tax=Chlamydomonas eustigma TaxID=1157962 RepID=A0A250X8D5_9CHLO|nr:hypothetical protein CEUSTIGMA_g6592.t1 [Chlamydomonas eustigma]|eukprot:GAX79152.1 hypothetical protein CEUSTIGMA_g6592.t1 [Chlamydomonas eustigma]